MYKIYSLDVFEKVFFFKKIQEYKNYHIHSANWSVNNRQDFILCVN